MAHNDILNLIWKTVLQFATHFWLKIYYFTNLKKLFILSQRYKIKSLSRNDSIPNPDPKFSKLNPDADFFKRNPDPESQNFKTQSQISIPNFYTGRL